MGALAIWELVKSLGQILTSRVGLPIVVAAVIFIGYEGLPLGPLRYIPFAGHYLAMIADGRVDHVRAQAKADFEAEARARAMALIAQRNDDNKEISDLDEAKLCVELGGRWVALEKRCD